MDNLKKALLYMHVQELKNLSLDLGLLDKGSKGILIERIVQYTLAGVKITEPVFPDASKAKRNTNYPLAPEMLMLKGAYKNDLKTRLFFRQLIGDHFHFTAFGIDWLNDKWMQGRPPTYQEFAQMWQTEYTNRKQQEKQPKEEWAYINFLQNAAALYPEASHDEVLQNWRTERAKQKDIALKIIEATRKKS